MLYGSVNVCDRGEDDEKQWNEDMVVPARMVHYRGCGCVHWRGKASDRMRSWSACPVCIRVL